MKIDLQIFRSNTYLFLFYRVVDSIDYAAKAIREGKDIPKPKQIGKIGKRQPKYDADKLTLGTAPYVDDLRFEGMLFGALKFSEFPRAKVINIDCSERISLS